MRSRIRGAVPKLTRVLAGVLLLAAAGAVADAATPAPPRINVLDIQPKALAPTKPLHVEFIVEVNRLG